MRTICLFAAIAQVLGSIGCSTVDSSGSVDDLLGTDRDFYIAERVPLRDRYQYLVDVSISFTNESRHAVYLSRCFPESAHPKFGVSLESPANPGGSAFGPVWACPGHDSPIVVVPGATRVDSITLRGPNVYQGESPLGHLGGMVRLVYHAYSCREPADCLSSETMLRSNEFAIHIP